MDFSVVVAIFVCVVPALVSSIDSPSMKDPDADFNYDYESLRIGGLTFAVVLFVLGIVLILTRKCSCKSKSRPAPPQRTIVPDPEAGRVD